MLFVTEMKDMTYHDNHNHKFTLMAMDTESLSLIGNANDIWSMLIRVVSCFTPAVALKKGEHQRRTK